jgi:hypothetical protein
MNKTNVIDWTKPLRTRMHYRKAKLISTQGRAPFSHILLVEHEQGHDYCVLLNEDGYTGAHQGQYVENVPETIEGYINIYPQEGDDFLSWCGDIYPNAERAIVAAGNMKTLARIKISVPIGRYDD